MSDGAYSGANLMNYVELCETRIRGLEEANGLMAQAAAEDGARIRLLEQQLSTAREALEPFASAFQQARLSYAKRYHNAPLDHGFSIFDKMPDKWPMELESFSMGDFRRAAAAIRSLGEKE